MGWGGLEIGGRGWWLAGLVDGKTLDLNHGQIVHIYVPLTREITGAYVPLTHTSARYLAQQYNMLQSSSFRFRMLTIILPFSFFLFCLFLFFCPSCNLSGLLDCAFSHFSHSVSLPLYSKISLLRTRAYLVCAIPGPRLGSLFKGPFFAVAGGHSRGCPPRSFATLSSMLR